MSTLMYDSTNPNDIPVNAEMVAGYLNGLYAWPAEGWARFAGKPVWQISITAQLGVGDVGNVLDVETGDAAPNQAGAWAQRTIGRGAFPILYCNRSNGPEVEFFLKAAQITPQQAALWVATLDGTSSVKDWEDGTSITYPVAAVQYLGDPASGGHYDLSLVDDAYGGFTGGSMSRADMASVVRCALTIRDGKTPDDATVNHYTDIAVAAGTPDAAVVQILGAPGTVHAPVAVHTHVVEATTGPNS